MQAMDAVTDRLERLEQIHTIAAHQRFCAPLLGEHLREVQSQPESQVSSLKSLPKPEDGVCRRKQERTGSFVPLLFSIIKRQSG
jgi:hypothetical protein